MQVVVQLPTEAGKKPVVTAVTAAAGSYPLLEDRGRGRNAEVVCASKKNPFVFTSQYV